MGTNWIDRLLSFSRHRHHDVVPLLESLSSRSYHRSSRLRHRQDLRRSDGCKTSNTQLIRLLFCFDRNNRRRSKTLWPNRMLWRMKPSPLFAPSNRFLVHYSSLLTLVNSYLDDICRRGRRNAAVRKEERCSSEVLDSSSSFL